MRKHSRTLLLTIIVTLAAGAGLQTASVAKPPRPTGHLTKSYHAAVQAAVPGWAQTAIGRARAQLRVNGRHTGLAARTVAADDLGMTHVRFDQLYKGVPVFGGQVIAHLDRSGRLVDRSGRLYRSIKLSARPGMARSAAIRSAKRALGYKGSFVQRPSARLLVLPLGKRRVLAYQVSLHIQDGTEATAHHEYFVNARTGKIAWRYDSLPHDDAVGTGNSLYSGPVSIHTDLVGATYSMIDNTRGGMRTTDMNNGSFGNGTIYTDADNVWGNGSTSSDQSAGVDAHFGAAQTWDFYLNVLGREGIDDNGYQMRSRTHYSSNYNNAFWDGVQMTYGDGDGVSFDPLVSLDVAGHEITHGVTQFTADLIYSKESGASNESFSDIFAAAVEFYTGPVAGHNPDYFVGEDIYLEPTTVPGFRNMADPLEDGDPDHYAIRKYKTCPVPSPLNDNCGVHTNSGIQNNAFYLLAEGGTNRTSGISVTGIGLDKAEQIFYRALAVYLTPSSNFKAVRVGTLKAANDLYPGSGGGFSTETITTNRAWRAVGVRP